MPEFKDKLKHLIKIRGMTQMEVAERFGVSHPAVNNWLNGAIPRPNKIKEIADFFGVSIEVLTNDTYDIQDGELTETYIADEVIDKRAWDKISPYLKYFEKMPIDMLTDAIELAMSNNDREMGKVLLEMLKKRIDDGKKELG